MFRCRTGAAVAPGIRARAVHRLFNRHRPCAGIAAAVVLCLAALHAISCGTASSSGDHGTSAEKRARLDAYIGEYQQAFPNVPVIRPEEIASAPDQYLWVDVRTAPERAVSRLPGALTQDEFEAMEASPTDTPVAVYCTAGYRSGAYAEALRNQGVEACNLAGGILAWVHAGLPLEGNARRVHVYGRAWDLLPPGYESVY